VEFIASVARLQSGQSEIFRRCGHALLFCSEYALTRATPAIKNGGNRFPPFYFAVQVGDRGRAPVNYITCCFY
jgi:hypothetical protein